MGLRSRAVFRERASVLLRLDQSRRGPVGRSRLRRNDGRAPCRSRQADRRSRLGDTGDRLAAGLQHHGRALGGQGHGPHGCRRRRVRNPRFRQGVRRHFRRTAVDGVHHPGARRTRQRDLAGGHVEARRGANLDHGSLRSELGPSLLEHRQRSAVELPGPQGRQPVVGSHGRAPRGQRRNRLGLPIHSLGLLGLRRSQHAGAGRPRA